MAKIALTIKRQDLFDLNRITNMPTLTGTMAADMPDGFFSMTTTMSDRAVCETDPSLLQLLPYCTITDRQNNKLFVYSRGKGGEEARLHGNLSIGVGGHIDTDLSERPVHGHELAEATANLMATELIREVEEEVGYKSPVYENWLTSTLIYDDTNPVGQVHLGILAELDVSSPDDLGPTEVGIIEGSQWMSLDELLAPAVFDRLENWSKIVVLELKRRAGDEGSDNW
jgi:predicted NUDIX family phosphoesterase